MADTLSPEQRRRAMAAVKNKDTSAEIRVRRLLHAMGYRYRLHRRDLPGAPDVVLPGRKRVIFVHGCFWHGHDCRRGRRPTTKTAFWDAKLDKNMERDRANQDRLRTDGWRVLVVWECELKDEQRLRQTLRQFMMES